MRRSLAREVLRVGRRKRLRVKGVELEGIGFVETREQRALEGICPRAHRRGDALLQSVGIDPLGLYRKRAGDDVDAREVGLGDLNLRFHADGIERVAYHPLDALPHDGVVFLARHEDQA